MKTNNIIRIILLTLVILFTVLYMAQAFGYYEYTAGRTNYLTEEAIKKFEQDVSSGKNVRANDYIPEINNYNNNVSRSGIYVSNTIEKVFNKVMGFLFSEMNKAING